MIDASIYIYRAWHLTPKTVVNPAGQCVNAVHGFADFLHQLIKQSEAQYLACAFDHAARPSKRQEINPDYKSDRAATPAGLRHQFALCQQLSETLGIQTLSRAGYEADDIIYTLAANAREKKQSVCVISGDKDLVQCIDKHDTYWNFANKLTLDIHDIEKRFGVKPSQFADLLALSGDKSDNIKGVPGIGSATAAKLLRKWGNLNALFENLAEVSQMKFRGAVAVSELLYTYKDQVRQSRKITDLFMIPNLRPEDLSRRAVNLEELKDFLTSHGFEEALKAELMQLVSP